MDSSLCSDISEFLDTLKDMRVVDDKIVYALNTSIPTESFSGKIDAHATCKDLFQQLVASHAERDNTLRKCLEVTVNKVQKLRQERESAPDDLQLLKRLRKEQTKMREIQTQVNVEEVIRGRSLKIYNERCRPFYKPSDHGATHSNSGLR